MEYDEYYPVPPVGCACIILLFVITIPIIIMIIKGIFVSNQPIGTCFAQEGQIKYDSNSSRTKVDIENVPVDMTLKMTEYNSSIELLQVTMKYPPPNTNLNIKTRENAERWISSTTSSKNGIICFVDIDKGKAWTEPVGIIG